MLGSKKKLSRTPNFMGTVWKIQHEKVDFKKCSFVLFDAAGGGTNIIYFIMLPKVPAH